MSDKSKSRTMSFVGAAGVSVLLAAISYFATQPSQSDGFELVGQQFYPEFESSKQAAQLEVYAVDADSAELKQFRVEENDGVWRIPSHYNYPAEASDRLAKTSSSLIGVTREALVGRTKADHQRYGVVDPLDEENLDPESTGKRITLKDKSGDVLVDLIVGNAADQLSVSETQLAFGQAAQSKDFYVRVPGKVQTYKAALDLDLSTRFSDWIRPDLLELEGSELQRMVIDNYELEEQADPLGRVTRLFKKQGDLMRFDRDSGAGPWTMQGLDLNTNSLDSAKINDAVRTLDNLKIVGVRKKTDYKGQQLLNADLTLNEIEELKSNIPLFRQIMAETQAELSNNGFNLAPAAQGSEKLTIVSASGEVSAGTGDGVVYTMHFGNPVSGGDEEIEIGNSNSEAKEPQTGEEKNEDEAEVQQPAAEGQLPDAEAEDDKEEIKNRFLMIRVAFDETLLSDKPNEPIEPVEPKKPEGYVAAEERSDEDSDDAAPKPEGEVADDAEAVADDAEATPDDAEPQDDRPEAFKEYDRLMEEFSQSKKQYELQLAQFEAASKTFEAKVAEGQKRVGELNERFGKWFYVIAADNLESLQLGKDDLVSANQPVEADIKKPGEGGLPTRPNIKLDGDLPMVPGLSESDSADEEEMKSETTPEAEGDAEPVNEGDAEPVNEADAEPDEGGEAEESNGQGEGGT